MYFIRCKGAVRTLNNGAFTTDYITGADTAFTFQLTRFR